ncbi:hypothetical protein HMPREF1991_02116 [Hoylesella loescheii DSM 19665 = JCM 12249 = ATCC 15930]|uniref:Uncharacterized protein n=1 Tax=Hoylesella loescheii DSM 19665 = JCM 12249 = ATCC 15930 TaxID=1122985 RepID=A0A069QPQ8_HOYLO|nr:hypothetical protein HMPREF1991_02116 [Hoylesella loescheii DSM 19665 = JCM 12249 = ATCC 15930]
MATGLTAKIDKMEKQAKQTTCAKNGKPSQLPTIEKRAPMAKQRM